MRPSARELPQRGLAYRDDDNYDDNYDEDDDDDE